MALYTINDTNNTQSADSYAEAVEIISNWYVDWASWATGESTPEEDEIVSAAIGSVDEPELGDSLQDYADAICTAIAEAAGGRDFFGHGNYCVRAADQMGLSLEVKPASAEVEDGVYFIHPDGCCWDAIRVCKNKIIAIAHESDANTHAVAGDDWSGVVPSDTDEIVEGDDAATLIRLYTEQIGRNCHYYSVSVSRPSEVD